MRTSSDEGRIVESQHDLLVIKIDNSPGKGVDPSVEVEYSDSESPIITTKSGTQPHSTVSGQRNQSTSGHDELWWDEDLDDIPLTSTEPDGADSHIEEILSDQQDEDGEFHDSQSHGEFIEDGQFEDIDGYGGGRIHHDSQGDTDEWEDCETEEYFGTQSSDSSVPRGSKSPSRVYLSPEDTLKIKILNPDAPVFTPISPTSPLSPEMMKTPEGHVKVANWAEEMKTPTSAKNLSFSSASPGSNENSPNLGGKSETPDTVKESSKGDIKEKNNNIKKDNTADGKPVKGEENEESVKSDPLEEKIDEYLKSSDKDSSEACEKVSGGLKETDCDSEMAISDVNDAANDAESTKEGDSKDASEHETDSLRQEREERTSDPSLQEDHSTEKGEAVSAESKEEEGSDDQSKQTKGNNSFSP